MSSDLWQLWEWLMGGKSPFKCPVKHVHETAVKCRGHLLACPAKIYTGMLGRIPTSHRSLNHFLWLTVKNCTVPRHFFKAPVAARLKKFFHLVYRMNNGGSTRCVCVRSCAPTCLTLSYNSHSYTEKGTWKQPCENGLHTNAHHTKS